STVQSNGECGKEVKKHVHAGWNEWRKVPETLALRTRHEAQLEVAEMKMMKFFLVVTRMDRIRNKGELLGGGRPKRRFMDGVNEDMKM
ncbi:hypothetical protein AMECASPLE_010898, partial [Ameca splendens]